jgi:hypothetical protein
MYPKVVLFTKEVSGGSSQDPTRKLEQRRIQLMGKIQLIHVDWFSFLLEQISSRNTLINNATLQASGTTFCE